MKFSFSREGGAVTTGKTGLFLQPRNWCFHQTNSANPTRFIEFEKKTGRATLVQTKKQTHFLGLEIQIAATSLLQEFEPNKIIRQRSVLSLHSGPSRLAIKATSARYYGGSVLKKQDGIWFFWLLNAKFSSQERTASRINEDCNSMYTFWILMLLWSLYSSVVNHTCDAQKKW